MAEIHGVGIKSMSLLKTGSFALRRIHSLAGLWFLLFLIEHLFTNSQAALWVGDKGKGFVDAVNFIHNLPYLAVIELVLLGIPILTHMMLGIQYALSAKINSLNSDGTKPSLGQYGRNRAYSWQRITSYFLLFMLIFHVARFRFLEYPKQIVFGELKHYLVKISYDPGVYTIASRMNVELYDQDTLNAKLMTLTQEKEVNDLKIARNHLIEQASSFDKKTGALASETQYKEYELSYRDLLSSFKLDQKGDLLADCQDFGTATILTVRDTFKNKIYAGLYTLFVIAAVFHGCNGFWTFLITWGLIFKKAAQKFMVQFSIMMMLLLGFLGLAAIWGTYFVTLKS